MSDVVGLVLAALAGVGLGLVYFGGLWLTLQRVPRSRSPALLAMVSFVGRTALMLVGFYFVMGDSWQRLVACLVGVVAARVALVRRLGPADAPRETPQGGPPQ
jgi:F1F0 ATPase subunit 2